MVGLTWGGDEGYPADTPHRTWTRGATIMATGDALSGFAAGMADGSLRVVDLTMPLGPETPVLPLPPPFPNSPMFEVTEISRYDDRGPAWNWNSFVTDATIPAHRDPELDGRGTGRLRR